MWSARSGWLLEPMLPKLAIALELENWELEISAKTIASQYAANRSETLGIIV
jgi:hypothetical protein